MSDTLGEDRLLDEVAEIEAALKVVAKERPQTHVNSYLQPITPGHCPECEWVLAHGLLTSNAPDWLARLCARVRHLEAVVEAYGVSVSQAGAECQRLTEALQNVVAHTGHLPEAPRELLIGLLASCARISKAALGAGAPPEEQK